MARRRLLSKREERDLRDTIKIFGPAVLITIIGFVVAYQFVAPAPPEHISIGAGPPESAYYNYAKAYKEILAQHGIELEVRPTAGSVENIRLLEADSDGVDVAFVQGGTGVLAQSDDLLSLGSLYFEPMWIFHQPDLTLKRLADLKGLRVGVGVEGSGTKVLALQMLGLNGITAENTRLFSDGHRIAADMLLNGELDVAIFVTTHRAAYLLELVDSKSAVLMGLERAEAYAFYYHYLHVLKVPAGVIDFVDNIPSHDLMLVAATAQLVARPNLHPALVDLLLRAAEETHEAGGEYEKIGEFPAPKYLDFELSEDAERFYESGPPFLQRYLPFWVATFLARMKVMVLPLLVLLFPFFKLMPPVYRWRIRSRIYRWYTELEAVDPEALKKEDITEHVEKYMAKLDRLEEKVSQVSIPLAYAEELYALRLHIELLRNRLLKASEKQETS
jgi:TRAP transporter TAXI family solute receptor